MAACEGYAAALARDVRRACGPPPSDLEDLGRWLDRELDVALVVGEPGACVAGCRGYARYEGRGGCRGVVILPAGIPHAGYWALHEAAHLLMGQGGYSLDTPRWRQIPAEIEADTFAACCLIDGAELYEELLAGWDLREIAGVHDVPVSVVARRIILAGREGIAGMRRFDRFLARPV